MGSRCCIGWATAEFNAPDALHESLGNAATSWCLDLGTGKVRHRRHETRRKLQLERPELCHFADGDVVGLAVGCSAIGP